MPNCHCHRCELDRSTLGFNEFVTFDVVATSYKELARVWHPDRFENDSRLRLRAEEEFKKLQQAFSSLKEHEVQTPPQPPRVASPYPVQPDPVTATVQATYAMQDETPYFAVSLLKLAVLSSCTFGIYQLYWFYKNWEAIRRRTGAQIQPFWRAVFAAIFCYRCFNFVGQDARQRGLKSPPMGLLACGWILCEISYRLPDPLWLVTFLSFLFVLPVQSLANKIIALETPKADSNTRFDGWNWAAVVAGVLWWGLCIVGLTVPNR
jgi:hypothetical protein